MKSLPQGCSDDRLALAFRGRLSSSELLEFATHLGGCADCRIAWRLSADFEGSAGPVPGDERIVARAAKSALASLPRPRVGLMRVAFAAAAVLAAAGMASAAITLHARRARSVDADTAQGPRSHRKGEASHTRAGGNALPAAEDQTPADVVLALAPAPVPRQDLGARAETSAPVSPRSRPSLLKDGRGPRRVAQASGASPALEPPSITSLESPELAAAKIAFAQAVAAREQGRLEDAMASFRAIQKQYPGTPEALVSLISLGELCLRTGAAAEALASFADYERNAPEGPLVPEALSGRARALASLGLTRESETVWRALAQRFPSSAYARRAAVDGAAP